MRHAPVAASVRPEAVRTQHQLALSVQAAPVLVQSLQIGDFLPRQREGGAGLLACLLVLGGEAGIECYRVAQRIEEGVEVGGDDVGDEPRDRLGEEDDVGGEPGGEEVPREDEVDEELEAGVIEDDVDAAMGLAAGGGLEVFEGGEGVGEVVDDDVGLGGFAGLRALQLLDVVVGKVREEGEVGRVAPEADLAHFVEEEGFGLRGVFGGRGGGAWLGAELRHEVFIAGS